MGAGCSLKRQTRIKYDELQKVRRELQKRGVVTIYDRGSRSVINSTCQAVTADFWVRFGSTSYASNGECFAPLIVSVVDRETGERRFYESSDYGKGIDHIVRDYAQVGSPLN